jgi:hypothetical protein
MTKSLHVALEDLKLERALIVHPGEASYSVHEKVEVLPLGPAVARVSRMMRRRR